MLQEQNIAKYQYFTQSDRLNYWVTRYPLLRLVVRLSGLSEPRKYCNNCSFKSNLNRARNMKTTATIATDFVIATIHIDHTLPTNLYTFLQVTMLYPLDETRTMQANYPKKLPVPHWDRVHLQYPVRKHPGTGGSSETVGRKWRDLPEVLKETRTPVEELKNYFRDYNVTKQLTRSQTAENYGFKLPETKRFNKHTSCLENEYVYPQPRRIEDRVPQCSAHGTTEMRSRYTPPVTPPRLITDKDQYKLPTRLPRDPLPLEPSWRTEIEPIDTTHEGFEKYLDPYLTTSRLHHRPYTADQLQRPSCNKDVVTYYTFKDIAYTRTPKPETELRLPVPRPKSVYDREKFKKGFREIRNHNKLQWVPGTFRTEARDNYISPTLQPVSQIHNYEEEARSYYKKSIANLSTNIREEYNAFQKQYSTENSVVGSRRPICSVLDQFIEKNKRLERKSVHIA